MRNEKAIEEAAKKEKALEEAQEARQEEPKKQEDKDALESGIEYYWRCEGCGEFLEECELVHGHGHELAEPGGYVRLCGPVNKEKR